MKKVIVKALMLLCFMAGSLLQAKAQNVTLVVTTNDGEEQFYQLSTSTQMHFENGDQLVITDGGNTTATFNLDNIRKIVCSELTSVDESTAPPLQLIPNPSHNSFIIRNLKSNCQARIFTLDGRIVKSFEATEGMAVDISDLSEGMYLLTIEGQTLKLMKL